MGTKNNPGDFDCYARAQANIRATHERLKMPIDNISIGLSGIKKGCTCAYINGHRRWQTKDCPVHRIQLELPLELPPIKSSVISNTEYLKSKGRGDLVLVERGICTCEYDLRGLRMKLNFNCEVHAK